MACRKRRNSSARKWAIHGPRRAALRTGTSIEMRSLGVARERDAKEVPCVPRGSARVVGSVEAAKQGGPRIQGPGFEIQPGLLHVIFGLVVIVLVPVFKYFSGFDAWIVRLHPS